MVLSLCSSDRGSNFHFLCFTDRLFPLEISSFRSVVQGGGFLQLVVDMQDLFSETTSKKMKGPWA